MAHVTEWDVDHLIMMFKRSNHTFIDEEMTGDEVLQHGSQYDHIKFNTIWNFFITKKHLIGDVANEGRKVKVKGHLDNRIFDIFLAVFCVKVGISPEVVFQNV